MRGRATTTKVTKPPPTTGQADGYLNVVFFQPDDIRSMAARAKLVISLDADLVAEAARLNEAFAWYAVWNEAFAQESPSGEKYEWCDAVATHAKGLLVALGHAEDASKHAQRGPGAPLKRDSFRDGMLILQCQWPAVDVSAADAGRLERWMRRASPAVAQGSRARGSNPLDEFLGASAESVAEPRDSREVAIENFWSFMAEQLPSALEAVALLAKRGAVSYGSKVSRGGSQKDYSIRILFTDLTRSYSNLFGEPPSLANARGRGDRDTVSTGPAMIFFRDLLAIVAERARLHHVQAPNNPAQMAHIASECDRLLSLNARSREKPTSLQGWISLGVKNSKLEAESRSNLPGQ